MKGSYRSLTPEEVRRKDIESLIKRVMSDEYVPLNVETFSYEENYANETVSANLSGTLATTPFHFSSKGVGLVDAIFKGLKSTFVENYKSLDNIDLESFQVYTNPKSSLALSGTCANVTVLVEFANARSKITPFRFSSLSLTQSVLFSLLGAVEYYINSELCYRKLKHLISDATRRARADVRAAYISDIVRIVGVSSYEEIL